MERPHENPSGGGATMKKNMLQQFVNGKYPYKNPSGVGQFILTREKGSGALPCKLLDLGLLKISLEVAFPISSLYGRL